MNYPIIHQLSNKDFYFPKWKVKYLFIGTFNPKDGDPVSYYYGRKTNYCWPILSEIFEVDLKTDNVDFFSEIQRLGIACVDIIDKVNVKKEWIKKVTGAGYKDTNIIRSDVFRNYNTSRIQNIIINNENIQVFSTWGKGPSLQEWVLETKKINSFIPLVSPSRAARVPKGMKKYNYILNDWKSKIKI